MTPTQTKLIEEMRREVRRLNDQATLLRMEGNHQLSEDMRLAASKLGIAINALDIAYAGELEAKELERGE